MHTQAQRHTHTHLRLWIPTFPSFFLLPAWVTENTLSSIKSHDHLNMERSAVYVCKHTYTHTQTHTHTHTHIVTDRGGYPKEGAGHQNYKVGQNECHGTTADEEQLNCSVYTHPQTYAMCSCTKYWCQNMTFDLDFWLRENDILVETYCNKWLLIYCKILKGLITVLNWSLLPLCG